MDRKSRQELVASAARSCYPLETEPEVIMKTATTIVFLLVGASSALGQTISNQRDMYGNLVRDGSNYAPRGVNQGPQNNGSIRSMPTRPATANVGRTQSR